MGSGLSEFDSGLASRHNVAQITFGTLGFSMSVGVGTHLGSLEITALLGRGGMGEVYRARDTKLKRCGDQDPAGRVFA